MKRIITFAGALALGLGLGCGTGDGDGSPSGEGVQIGSEGIEPPSSMRPDPSSTCSPTGLSADDSLDGYGPIADILDDFTPDEQLVELTVSNQTTEGDLFISTVDARTSDYDNCDRLILEVTARVGFGDALALDLEGLYDIDPGGEIGDVAFDVVAISGDLIREPDPGEVVVYRIDGTVDAEAGLELLVVRETCIEADCEEVVIGSVATPEV